MRRRILGISLAVVGTILVAMGAYSRLGAADEAPPSAPIRPVRTVTARAVDIRAVLQQTGEIQARRETSLGFQLGGKVARRIVDIGDQVAAGDLVASLDDTDVANELRAAEAELESANSLAVQANASLVRARELSSLDATSRADLEAAEANQGSARAKQTAAQVAVEAARRRLGYTQLRSPEGGVVTAVGANAGQVVAPGQTILVVSSSGEREALFHVAESVLNVCPPDVEVEVALVSDPNVRTTGKLRELNPIADPLTRTSRVRISLREPPEAMSLGTTVTGRILLPADRLFDLPATAITSANGEPAVFVVDPANSSLILRPVRVARYHAASALVQSGIANGDLVVVAGVSKLRPGQTVRLETERR